MQVVEQKRRCDLVLHCGATTVPRVEVARVSTPRPTDTWTPIPHVTLIEEVESALRATGMKIRGTRNWINQVPTWQRKPTLSCIQESRLLVSGSSYRFLNLGLQRGG